MNSRALPHFDNPPVVETVIGVQFSPISNYSNAHAGWFWKSFLDSSWDGVTEVPRLDDMFERFGGERAFAQVQGIMLGPSSEGQRMQFINSSSGRMVQIQNTRLILNWRTNPADRTYPSFSILKDEFLARLEDFRAFAVASGTPELTINQWEVVYVNHISKGELWDKPADWAAVLNFFAVPNNSAATLDCDTFGGQWSLALPEKRGRLHVSVQHGRVENARGPEIMVLQLTARGDVGPDRSLADHLEIGHATIVDSFAAMTSETAHKHWKRTQ